MDSQRTEARKMWDGLSGSLKGQRGGTQLPKKDVTSRRGWHAQICGCGKASIPYTSGF